MEALFTITLIFFSPYLVAFEVCCVSIISGALFYKLADKKRYKTIKLFNRKNLLIASLSPIFITTLLVMCQPPHPREIEPLSVLINFQGALFMLALFTLGGAVFFKLLFGAFKQ